MSSIARTDPSVLGRWWWTVDRWTLLAVGLLIFFGSILIMAASPPVAERIGLPSYHFVRQHFIMLFPALVVLIGTSLLSPQWVRRLAVLLFLGAVALMVAVLLFGDEIKGASRWIRLFGFSLQPSEFVKPAFAVLAAWMFSEKHRTDWFPGYVVASFLYVVVVSLLLAQPDLGMAVVVTIIWLGQFFLAGLHMAIVVLFLILGVIGMVTVYLLYPHVTSRINRFIFPLSGDNYQVEQAIRAFRGGGLLGRGPGEGTVISALPDAHADFVFAVVGEEFGLLISLLLVALFGFIVLRAFARLLQEQNLFVLLAASGLYAQFGLQALINMGSTLRLIPTKGMTLPFISYGGSSLMALAMAMGMAMALTRRRASMEDI